jgi:hypothetical protein
MHMCFNGNLIFIQKSMQSAFNFNRYSRAIIGREDALILADLVKLVFANYLWMSFNSRGSMRMWQLQWVESDLALSWRILYRERDEVALNQDSSRLLATFKLTNTSRVCAFPALRAHCASPWSRCHISKLFTDGTWHGVTTDYAVTGWRKAFRIVDGEHLKTRLNVLEPGCARTLATCDLSVVFDPLVFFNAGEWFFSNSVH